MTPSSLLPVAREMHTFADVTRRLRVDLELSFQKFFIKPPPHSAVTSKIGREALSSGCFLGDWKFAASISDVLSGEVSQTLVITFWRKFRLPFHLGSCSIDVSPFATLFRIHSVRPVIASQVFGGNQENRSRVNYKPYPGLPITSL